MACVFNGKCVQSKQAPVSFFMAACRWCQSLTICVCTAAFHYTVHALKLNMLYILCVFRILLLWLTWLTLETWDFVFGKYLLVICAWVMFFFFLYESCGLFSSRNQKVYTFQLIFHVFAASMLHNSCPAAHCCCTVEAAFLCHQGGASLCNWHTSPEPTRSVSTLPSDWLHGPLPVPRTGFLPVGHTSCSVSNVVQIKFDPVSLLSPLAPSDLHTQTLMYSTCDYEDICTALRDITP